MPDPGRFLPLRPDVFTILLTLMDGDTHGYGIIKRARAEGPRRGQLQPGALYRLLRELQKEGLVEEAAPPAGDASADERRRYYHITTFGKAVARAEARRMEALVGASRQRRLLKG